MAGADLELDALGAVGDVGAPVLDVGVARGPHADIGAHPQPTTRRHGLLAALEQDRAPRQRLAACIAARSETPSSTLASSSGTPTPARSRIVGARSASWITGSAFTVSARAPGQRTTSGTLIASS